MSKVIDKIEKRYRIPCGPMDISADGVCRRRLRDRFDDLLDKLTEQVHPEMPESEVPSGYEMDEKGNLVSEEDKKRKEEAAKAREKAEADVEKELSGFDKALSEIMDEEDIDQKKERLIEEGKMKAEVKAEIKKYEEKLMGNSKMLQDISGKIPKR